MAQALAVARYTLIELTRRRVLVVIVAIGVVLMAGIAIAPHLLPQPTPRRADRDAYRPSCGEPDRPAARCLRDDCHLVLARIRWSRSPRCFSGPCAESKSDHGPTRGRR